MEGYLSLVRTVRLIDLPRSTSNEAYITSTLAKIQEMYLTEPEAITEVRRKWSTVCFHMLGKIMVERRRLRLPL